MNTENLTENDKQLLAQAHNLTYCDWYKADEMAEKADSEEVKEELLFIGRVLYHKEEYYAGLL